MRPDQIVSLQELLGLVARMATTFAMVLLSCFGFALLMAITGIYGIAARSVTRRIHEIGIRRAVGATEHGIVRLFLRRGSRQLLIGLSLAAVIGAPASLAVHQFLQLNITAYIIGASVVPALIAMIVFAAIYIPTRRALRLEPSVALWRE